MKILAIETEMPGVSVLSGSCNRLDRQRRLSGRGSARVQPTFEGRVCDRVR